MKTPKHPQTNQPQTYSPYTYKQATFKAFFLLDEDIHFMQFLFGSVLSWDFLLIVSQKVFVGAERKREFNLLHTYSPENLIDKANGHMHNEHMYTNTSGGKVGEFKAVARLKHKAYKYLNI